MIPLPDPVRRSYSALVRGEGDAARPHCVDDVVCHIGGAHPFTGDYSGVGDIVDVLRRMDEVGGRHEFTVTNVMSDDSGSQVLIEGVARNDGYIRHVIKRLRFDDGQLAEMWIRPLDQRAEDDFWLTQVPRRQPSRIARAARSPSEAGNEA